MADVNPRAGMGGKLDNLRGKPKDEKTVIAGSIAVTVVAILIIAWGILFLKKITKENQATNTYDLSSLQNQVDSSYSSNSTRGTAQDPFGAANTVPSANSSY